MQERELLLLAAPTLLYHMGMFKLDTREIIFSPESNENNTPQSKPADNILYGEMFSFHRSTEILRQCSVESYWPIFFII